MSELSEQVKANTKDIEQINYDINVLSQNLQSTQNGIEELNKFELSNQYIDNLWNNIVREKINYGKYTIGSTAMSNIAIVDNQITSNSLVFVQQIGATNTNGWYVSNIQAGGFTIIGNNAVTNVTLIYFIIY